MKVFADEYGWDYGNLADDALEAIKKATDNDHISWRGRACDVLVGTVGQDERITTQDSLLYFDRVEIGKLTEKLVQAIKANRRRALLALLTPAEDTTE